MAQHNDLGKKGEQLAVDYLVGKGYVIIEKNYRFQKAEVDVIAQKENVLVAVEVKTRSSVYYGNPQDFVNPKKIKLLAFAIDNYVIEKDLDVEIRFDIIAVIKNKNTFKIEHILPLINYGHIDFGENKVQEAVTKWTEIKIKNKKIKLHLIGKLQTNKVKFAVKIFDYIHSLDSEKLAKKIADEQNKQRVKPKIFIQINLGEESQKSGISKDNLLDFYNFSKSLGLDIIGTMCIPPFDEDSTKYFSQMNDSNKKIKLTDLSMGMSSDYLNAIEFQATYLRIGSNIFGQRD